MVKPADSFSGWHVADSIYLFVVRSALGVF
jgi:hypothetical protein